MSKFNITKRILAGTLAALMVLTSAPADVFADEVLVEEAVLFGDESFEEEISEGDSVEELLTEDSSDSGEKLNPEASEEEDMSLAYLNLYNFDFVSSAGDDPLIGEDPSYPNKAVYLQETVEGGFPATEEDGVLYAKGTLHYVDGYKAFSPDTPELWSGYFYAYEASSNTEYLYAKAVNGPRPDNDYQNPEWGDLVTGVDIISFANAEQAKNKYLVLTAVNGDGENAKAVACKIVSFERVNFEKPVLEVEPLDEAADLFGKHYDDLQDNDSLKFDYGEIIGKLYYVDDYQGFGETDCKHFLALKVRNADKNCENCGERYNSYEYIKVFTDKGDGEEKAVNLIDPETGNDGIVVVSIADDATKLTIKAKTKSGTFREGMEIEQTYDLTKLVLDEYEVGVYPCEDTTVVFDKQVGELQKNVDLDDNKFTGTLRYVDSYPGWGTTDRKHFLALYIDEAKNNSDEYEYIKAFTDAGSFEEAKNLIDDPDHDGIAVLAIADGSKKFTIKGKTINGTEFTQEYDITGLKLESYEQQNEIQVSIANSDLTLLGKSVEKLQKDVAIDSKNAISGTLKYVDSYPGWGTTDRKHFLALYIEEADDNYENYDSIKAFTDKGTIEDAGDLITDESHDGITVLAIADGSKELSVVIKPKNGEAFTQKYDISGLKLETYEETYRVTVAACPDNETVFGKSVSDLQEIVELGSDNNIYGGLKYVDSYPEWGTTDRKHFLALYIDEAKNNSDEYEYIKAFTDKGSFEEAGDLITDESPDGITVLSIADNATKLFVKSKPKCGDEITQVFGLTKLTLLENPNPDKKGVEVVGYFDGDENDSVLQYTDYELSVNDVVQESQLLYSGRMLFYTLKPGDKYKLSIKTNVDTINGSIFTLANYSVGTGSCQTREFNYGKKTAIKNNTFTYSGVVKENDTRIEFVAYNKNYATTSKDMTVKQKAKSIYTGERAVIANVKFAKNITECEQISIRVDDGQNVGSYHYDYDQLTGDLWFAVDRTNTYIYGKHKITITAPGAPGSYQPVSKTITVNILRSITKITINGGSPISLYKANGKAVSVPIELKITGYDGQPAASKKVKYEIVDNATDEPVSGVTVKNGKIVVDKNFSLKSNQKFKLTVDAADWYANACPDSTIVNIYNTKADLAEFFAVIKNGNTGNYDRVKDNKLIFDKLDDYKFLIRPSIYAIKDSYTGDEVAMLSNYTLSRPLTVKSSSSAVKVALGTSGGVEASNPVKNFTVTATVQDGSKVSVKSAKYSIVYSEVSELRLAYEETEVVCLYGKNSMYAYPFSFNPKMPNYHIAETDKKIETRTNTIELIVGGIDKDGNEVVGSNFSISVEGGKKQAVKGSPYLLRVSFKNNKPITVTLKNKKTKESRKYTFVSKYEPKLVSIDKLTAGNVVEQKLTVRTKFPESVPAIEIENMLCKYVDLLPVDAKSFNALVSIFAGGGTYDAEPRIEGHEIVTDIVLRNASFAKGKYKFLLVFTKSMSMGSNLTDINAVLPITIEAKAAPKVGLKVKKNGEVFNINRYAGVTYNTSKVKNLDFVEFTDCQNVIINGKANRFTDYFNAFDGKIVVTDSNADIDEINANNRGYVGYKAYNGNSYVEGHMYVTINVSGERIKIGNLTEEKYGVDPNNFQSNAYVEPDFDGVFYAKGELKEYDESGWTPGTWSEAESKGFYFGFTVNADCTPENGKTISIAKVVRGERDIEWKKLTDGFVIAHLEPDVDYEGILIKISDKNGKELSRYTVNLDRLKAEYN